MHDPLLEQDAARLRAALSGLTEDGLLGGRLRLLQPAAGYRVAIDPVLLAAAVPAKAGDHVLDAGAGTGAAALCLVRRVEACRVTGIEIDVPTAELGARNALGNDLSTAVEIVTGDLLSPPAPTRTTLFDHVMTNPPFVEAGRGTRPPSADRARSHVASVEIGDWLTACLRRLRSRGTLTLIHRADRLAAILSALDGPAGDIVVCPLWPKASAPEASRVLVRARKGAGGCFRLARGLVLHEEDGSFTRAADMVLREGAALDLLEC